jgi:hypothetical protein
MHMLKAKEYFQSFDYEIMAGVRQAFEYFGCCEHILAELEEMHKERLEHARKDAEEAYKPGRGRPSAAKLAERRLARFKGEVVGEHECGGKIIEYEMPSCERVVTGRKTYSECDKCTWYSEVFLETTEVEYEGQQYIGR